MHLDHCRALQCKTVHSDDGSALGCMRVHCCDENAQVHYNHPGALKCILVNSHYLSTLSIPVHSSALQ